MWCSAWYRAWPLLCGFLVVVGLPTPAGSSSIDGLRAQTARGRPSVQKTSIRVGGGHVSAFRVDIFTSNPGDEYVYVSSGNHVGVTDLRGRSLGQFEFLGACCGGEPTELVRAEYNRAGQVVVVTKWDWVVPVEGPERFKGVTYYKKCFEVIDKGRASLKCEGEP